MDVLGKPNQVRLDGIASARPAPGVVEGMIPWLSERIAHPDAPHAAGARARRAIEEARGEVASLLGVPAEHVVFTSGATESIHLAIRGWAGDDLRAGRARIAVAAHEHVALLHTARSLGRAGAVVELLPVGRDGLLEPGAIPGGPLTLLAFAHGHAELGSLQPAAALCERARIARAASLIDLSLTAGRMPLDRTSLGDPDLLVLSFYRMGGPLGIGAWIVGEEARVEPVLAGGPQERGLRPGTPNLAGIVGAGIAARLARESAAERRAVLDRAVAPLAAILARLPGVRPSGPEPPHRVPGHCSFVVDGVEGDALLAALEQRGILAATGSPCADLAGLPASALLAAGYEAEEARSSIVLCLGTIHPPGADQLAAAGRAIAEEIGRLRRIAGSMARPGS